MHDEDNPRDKPREEEANAAPQPVEGNQPADQLEMNDIDSIVLDESNATTAQTWSAQPSNSNTRQGW